MTKGNGLMKEIEELRRLGRNAPFDEQPCPELNSEVLGFRVASELVSELKSHSKCL